MIGRRIRKDDSGGGGGGGGGGEEIVVTPAYRGPERRKRLNRDYDGPDRRQDTRVYEILGELSAVAHDLQARSSTLVAMVEILQKEVIRQDEEDVPPEEKEVTLAVLEETAKKVVKEGSTEGLKEILGEEDG